MVSCAIGGFFGGQAIEGIEDVRRAREGVRRAVARHAAARDAIMGDVWAIDDEEGWGGGLDWM